MKKTFFLLIILVGLLTSCHNDDADFAKESDTSSNKVHWYGINKTYILALRGVADESKLWNPQAGITIKFINTPAEANMIERIKSIASEWEMYAGIKFNYVESDKNASVRIAFDWQGNDWLTWSYTGTDAKYERSQAEPTAVFGGLQYQDQEQFKGDVLRLFGQILGLEYEQRHLDWTFWRDEAKLQSYWTDMFDGMDMDWNEIRDYVFTPLSGDNAISPTQTPEIDQLSVMAWPYYTRTQTTRLLANFELSDGDKAFIATLYPKDKQTLPSIQEAWVDAGYFTWTDTTKSALRITEFGKQQESFPDVSDGEQLTSGEGLFVGSKLKKVPKFDTSNIINFNAMFYMCSSLTTVPVLNTAKGTSFSYMFANCSSLTSIPVFNTSRGTNFSYMFSYCTSLSEIPQFDTSNGIDFTAMFRFCPITTIPLLNTSNGFWFRSMFYRCSALTSIPQINTSQGQAFDQMFYTCSSLQEKPNLDLSKATSTTDMYKGTRFAN